nr:MAG TPA: hypothetical protein [Caudoviricetes sp.]
MCSSSLVILVCTAPRLTKVRRGVMLCLGDGRQAFEASLSCQARPSPLECTDLNRPARSLNNAWAYPLGDRGVEAHTAGNNRGRGRVGAAMQKADTIPLP